MGADTSKYSSEYLPPKEETDNMTEEELRERVTKNKARICCV